MNHPTYRRARRRPPALDRIIIAGAGRAGLAAAEELRERGFQGELLLLGAEPDPPYDRPACSKGILNGRQRPVDVTLPVRAGTELTYGLGRTAAHLDPTARVLMTDDGEEFEYDGLVIATGSRPALPAGWPVGEPGFHVLYGLSEAWRLRQSLRGAGRVAIVGGGLSGCETACAVRSMARECVIVDSNLALMRRALGDIAAEYVTDEILREGVRLRLGRRVQAVRRQRRGWVLRLDDGTEEVADVVVAALGERPDVEWLRAGTGWDLSDGVLCDESLRVLGAPGIVAAGTVARWPNLRFGTPPARCGQWIAALEQGQLAARALLAGDGYAEPAGILPRYWSDQFGLRIQVSGVLPSEAEVAVTTLRPGRRDVARSGVLVSYAHGGRLVGLVAVNAPHAFTAVTRAMLASPCADLPAHTVHRGWRHLTAVA